MVDRFKRYSDTRPRLRRFVGWGLVVFGFVMLVTPLTPGGSLFFIGLEILGLRMIFMEKAKRIFGKRKLPEAHFGPLPHAETAQ